MSAECALPDDAATFDAEVLRAIRDLSADPTRSAWVEEIEGWFEERYELPGRWAEPSFKQLFAASHRRMRRGGRISESAPYEGLSEELRRFGDERLMAR